MNAKVSILFISLGLMACSAQPPAPAVSASAAPFAGDHGVIPPPPEISIELPFEQPKIDSTVPRLCQLGTSCLAMDKRPFETCLVGAKPCDGDPPRPLPVEQRVLIKPAPR